MTDTPPFLAAIDAALEEVDRARRRGLQAKDGTSADVELDVLEHALRAERDAAHARGAVDRTVVGALVRDLVRWYPDDQVRLIAALGKIAAS
jgi:hypothetical protein